MPEVIRHYVDRKPEHAKDTSRVLCVRAGTCKPRPKTGKRLHGWTLNRAEVTCQRCLEWIHA